MTANPLEESVVVIGTGARTVVGMTAPTTAAAVRAGIARFGEHPFMVDSAGKRMTVGIVPYLDIEEIGAERLAALAGAAAVEATYSLLSVLGSTSPIAVFIGLPAERPGRRKDLNVVVDRVRNEIAATGLTARRVTVFETGHAAGAMAILEAWKSVRSGAVQYALAGGVDSYLEPETLEWLEENEQLHSAGHENNAYGFIPGEAAGFVLLTSARLADRYRLSTALEIVRAAIAQETKLIKTDSVCLGEGLTALFRTLSGEPPLLRANHFYCDMNGEPYRADEFGFASIRAGGLFVDPTSFSAPADCWGDVGAASGPLYLVLADAATRKRYIAGDILAAFTSAESGQRCGFVVRRRALQRDEQWR